MGMFDGYQFDPNNFGGGLLGLLAQNGINLPMGQPQGGFPAMPPTDVSAAQRQPGQGVTLPQQGASGFGRDAGPQNPFAALFGGLGDAVGGLFGGGGQQAQQPQLSAQQAPQGPQAAPSGPGPLDHLTAAWQGLGHGGLTSALGGLVTGQRQDPQGLLERALVSRGVSPDMAHAGVANPQLLPTLLADMPQQATLHALIQAGVPPAVAQAAALNPEVLKTIAPQLYQKPQLVDSGQDPFSGQKFHQLYNPNTQQLSDLAPQGGAGGSPSGPMPATMTQVFDKIEQIRNAGGTQQEMLQALPNSVRDATGALLAGRAIPANFSMRGSARDMMLRAATAIDPNFDATLIPQRTAFAHGMAQTTPNSFGGQKILLNTSIQHAGEIADQFTRLHNTNGGIISDIPGSEYLARGVNAVSNSRASMGDVTNAINDIGQKLAGEVGKLYSGSSGGGEAERQATASRFSVRNTPQQTIGALEATRNLILDKLNSLQNNRDQVYGASGENVYPLVDKQTRVSLQKIDDAIKVLRGGQGAPEQQQGAQLPRPASHAEAAKLPKGSHFLDPNGVERVVP